MRSLFQKVLPFILAYWLCLTTLGCVSSRYPPETVLKEALLMQIGLTERLLDGAFDLDEGFADVISVKADSIKVVENTKNSIISVSGKSDLRFLGTKEKTSSFFQLYLQKGEKGESWRLARPQVSSAGMIKDWLIYPLLLNPEI